MRTPLTLAALTLVLAAPAVQAQSQQDLNAIRKLENSWRDAWNRHDAEEMADLVDDRVEFLTINGQRIKGKQEVVTYLTTTHRDKYKQSRWTTRDIRIEILKPTVAVVHVDWTLDGEKRTDGSAVPSREGSFSRVVTKHGTKWLILASQTPVMREVESGS